MAGGNTSFASTLGFSPNDVEEKSYSSSVSIPASSSFLLCVFLSAGPNVPKLVLTKPLLSPLPGGVLYK